MVSSLKDIANEITSTLAHSSSIENYNPHFLNFKKIFARSRLDFKSHTDLPYNRNFAFQELHFSLAHAHKSSPGPDNISYTMIKHLTSESQKKLIAYGFRTNKAFHPLGDKQ
ncbi:hypothetical protein AVEN_273849-1 [Araneus ventricosus]|uniref:Reverse transcriptase domain-containing protein n=1 Tax=Araneus ventricosus TaxID=182803 RepID=A0A4Y2L0K4_ARAVE|nr:hypothetical protein AVEN_273849-1 [Araneus ventricosus]